MNKQLLSIAVFLVLAVCILIVCSKRNEGYYGAIYNGTGMWNDYPNYKKKVDYVKNEGSNDKFFKKPNPEGYLKNYDRCEKCLRKCTHDGSPNRCTVLCYSKGGGCF